jgi:two-component system CheB/CheR fusion protein
MAFVVVQHLSPDHQSMLPDLIARSTRMSVAPAKDGDEVEPNRVYVIPPDADLSLADGTLTLGRRTKGRPLTVDKFLESLALSCAERAIGVILSGTGADGARGIRVLKSSGGVTFAQDAKSAKFPEMPRNAVASGAVDFVLPPRGIAQELSRIGKHPFVLGATEPADGDETVDVQGVLDALRRVIGIDLSPYRQSTIRRRILRRMALERVERVADYVDRLRKDPAEAQALHEDVLIGVTSFFRDEAAFRAITKRVVPAILEGRSPDASVRVWVAGCASGEEVYSIAMCVLEHLARRPRGPQVQIFGTDASAAAVERARAGDYPTSIASDVTPDRLGRYFVRTSHGYRVGRELREMCVFARHDLARDPPFSKVDFLSCRNVLIYFSPLLQARVLSLFQYALNPGGWLLLGSTEHVGGAIADMFSPVDRKIRLFVRREGPAGGLFGARQPEAVAPDGGGRQNVERTRPVDLQREVDQVLMSRYAPAGVVVDDDLFIVQYRGHTGAYLEPRAGSPSLDLVKMTREGLAGDVRAAFQRCRRTGRPARREGVRMRTDGRLTQVNVEVMPLRAKPGRSPLYLVLFEPAPRKDAAPKGRRASTKGGHGAARELEATRELLHTVVEEQEATNQELVAANEEILSSNEELQSTNEELETAKEELQSSNEELTTLNEELQTRNQELSVVNDDLANFVGSTEIPVVMLGSDLRIRRVTPAAARLLNVLPGDVGRPLTDVRARVDVRELPRLVAEVGATMTTREQEVLGEDGHWYSMRVRPYVTRDNRVDGVVVAWADVDEIRRGATETARVLAQNLLDGIPTPAAVVDESLRVEAVNAAWLERWPAALAADGSPTRRPWDDAALDEVLEAVLGGSAPFDSRPFLRAGKSGTISAKRIPWGPAWRLLVVVVPAPAAAT